MEDIAGLNREEGAYIPGKRQKLCRKIMGIGGRGGFTTRFGLGRFGGRRGCYTNSNYISTILKQ